MGVTTANVDTRNHSQENSSQKPASSRFMEKVSRWGQKMIQIGSRYMPDPMHLSQDWAAGRRLNTSHQGTHILTSLDGTVIMKPSRGERSSLEIRNQNINASHGHNSSLGKAFRRKTHQNENVWASMVDKNPITCGESMMSGNRFVDFGSMNKSMYRTQRSTNTNTRGTTVHEAKRLKRSRQRQINDMFNLGALQSERVQNIKVSRLNELGMKEEGNPINGLNKLKKELDQRTEILLTGG